MSTIISAEEARNMRNGILSKQTVRDRIDDQIRMAVAEYNTTVTIVFHKDDLIGFDPVTELRELGYSVVPLTTGLPEGWKRFIISWNKQ